VLIDEAPGLERMMPQNGSLVLSGLLKQDEPDICLAFSKLGLRSIKRLEKQNWLSILFTR
jgi:ribosomal protein L11 methylase PrmA